LVYELIGEAAKPRKEKKLTKDTVKDMKENTKVFQF
jgi:hypothetical protein